MTPEVVQVWLPPRPLIEVFIGRPVGILHFTPIVFVVDLASRETRERNELQLFSPNGPDLHSHSHHHNHRRMRKFYGQRYTEAKHTHTQTKVIRLDGAVGGCRLNVIRVLAGVIN